MRFVARPGVVVSVFRRSGVPAMRERGAGVGGDVQHLEAACARDCAAIELHSREPPSRRTAFTQNCTAAEPHSRGTAQPRNGSASELRSCTAAALRSGVRGFVGLD
jgi:hypothetical protein